MAVRDPVTLSLESLHVLRQALEGGSLSIADPDFAAKADILARVKTELADTIAELTAKAAGAEPSG
jgi:hypothetical protein